MALSELWFLNTVEIGASYVAFTAIKNTKLLVTNTNS